LKAIVDENDDDEDDDDKRRNERKIRKIEAHLSASILHIFM
jgi:hypothetical protein